MIERRIRTTIETRLAENPAVALLGPRQVGKTTLALILAAERPSVYLDLQSPRDLAKLADPELYLSAHESDLVVIDEVHRAPELFGSLRGLIDRGRRAGRGTGRFLLLGSASMDLLQQSSESLAGRISYVEMSPIDALEVTSRQLDQLWARGGFPLSLLAASNEQSQRWREDFIRTYLERDIPQFGRRIAAETLRRLWTMLAHRQGAPLNVAELARGLALDGKTVAGYLDLFADLLLVRRLPAWHGNVGKRLVRSPKIYVRDSGIVHALLGLVDLEAVLGHPVVGGSWEGFVIESLLAATTPGTNAHFYRTTAGAEIDLLLTFPGGDRWAVEIKRGLAPSVRKGFHIACEDLHPSKRFVVYAGVERYPIGNNVEAIGLVGMANVLASERPTSRI